MTVQASLEMDERMDVLSLNFIRLSNSIRNKKMWLVRFQFKPTLFSEVLFLVIIYSMELICCTAFLLMLACTFLLRMGSLLVSLLLVLPDVRKLVLRMQVHP